MINEILFPLLAFVLVFSGGLFLVFGFQDYKKRNKKKYDFLTSFPFELVQGNGRGSFLGFVLSYMQLFMLLVAFMNCICLPLYLF